MNHMHHSSKTDDKVLVPPMPGTNFKALQPAAIDLSHPVGVPIHGSSKNDVNNPSMREVINGSPPLNILTPPRWFSKSAKGLIHPWKIYPSFWLNRARSLDWGYSSLCSRDLTC